MWSAFAPPPPSPAYQEQDVQGPSEAQQPLPDQFSRHRMCSTLASSRKSGSGSVNKAQQGQHQQVKYALDISKDAMACLTITEMEKDRHHLLFIKNGASAGPALHSRGESAA
uniref:Uncharacterized protein n=1 Tax=Sphaerodactylus townsendi TaxID=933632 RepID=A0ACB8ERD6_9SAUR